MSRLLRLLPVVAIWAGAATAVAIPARRVVDWFVMTDELLYERLAFSVARTGSPLPALHGAHVPVANQLYPLLLAAVAGHGLVPAFLVRAHTLNAIVMTSAAVPTYLLARDLLRSTRAAYAAAALAVVVPWLVLASFLLTDAVAYPAFVWAVYLLQRADERPSPRTDALAVLGVVVAFLARTQFVFLGIVAVLVVLRDPRRHRALAATVVLAGAAVLVLAAAGHGSSVLGSYSATAHGSPVGLGTPRLFAQHAATLALALGVLPALLGAAWLTARVVPAAAVLLLLLEVTSFDTQFGGNLPRDRYLYYAAPLLLIGFVGAVGAARMPRSSLAGPLVVVLAGLATAPLPTFDKLNADMPTAILDDYVRRSGGRMMLVAATLLLLAIFVLARRVVPRRAVAVVLVAATATALAAETAYAFDRLLRVNGTSGRPITVSQGGVFDWIDRTVGTGADVTFVAYAQVSGDYWATAGYWWDLEFWNRSVVRAAYPGNRFAEIQSTFPKLDLRFDPQTGRASASPTRYVAESDRETRFRVRGATVSLTRDVRLIDAGRRWRADWISSGLDDDGFTVPGRVASVRVFPAPGQTRPLLRYVSFHLLAHSAPESATIGAATTRIAADADADVTASVCVPPHGYGTLRLVGHGSSRVGGDLGTRAGIGRSRVRSVQVGRISLADETARC